MPGKIGNSGAHIGSPIKRRESFFAVLNIYNFTGAVLQKLRVIDNLAPFDKELMPKAPTISIPTKEIDPEKPKDFAAKVEPDAVSEAPSVNPAVSWANISEAETFPG